MYAVENPGRVEAVLNAVLGVTNKVAGIVKDNIPALTEKNKKKVSK